MFPTASKTKHKKTSDRDLSYPICFTAGVDKKLWPELVWFYYTLEYNRGWYEDRETFYKVGELFLRSLRSRQENASVYE